MPDKRTSVKGACSRAERQINMSIHIVILAMNRLFLIDHQSNTFNQAFC